MAFAELVEVALALVTGFEAGQVWGVPAMRPEVRDWMVLAPLF